MGAGLVVDLNASVDAKSSVANQAVFPSSGAIVGAPVDMLYSDTFCNLQVVGGLSQSGKLNVQIQTSPSTTSGSFTDPTSGLSQMPTSFSSGGVLEMNTGAGLKSGFIQHAGFQRPHRYARAIVMSGNFWKASLGVGFVSQWRTTGSGGGQTYAPSSGTVSV